MNGFLFATKAMLKDKRPIVQSKAGNFCGFEAYGNIHFAIDGTLFNEAELLEQTQTTTLPEAIYCGWQKWGEDLVSHMRGAFAFALFDESTFYFAKDALGLHPLYYGMKDGFFCGSDINQLYEMGLFEPVVDRDGLTQLFAIGPAMGEHQTLYRDVRMPAMGEYGVYQLKSGQVETHVYYELRACRHEDTFAQTVQKVRDLITASIHEQLPYVQGSLLSGGLDSSILCAVGAKQEGFRTYALDYEGNSEHFVGNTFQVSLDAHYIDLMVKRFGFPHQLFTISQQTLCDEVANACLKRGFPGMADVDASMLWLFQRIKEDGVHAVFSGECSDEAFCGYPWEYREELQCDTFPWTRYSMDRVRLLHEDLKDLPLAEYAKKRYDQTVAKVQRLAEDSEADYRARVHTMLVVHWFMQTLTVRQATMSDGAGLRVFAPFADPRIFDYAYNIPWTMKFADGEEKGILRKAFAEALPDAILHRKKNPYPKTHHPHYAKLIAAKLKEACADPDSVLHQLFDAQKLHALIESGGESYQQPWYGQLMSGPQLLAYLYQIHVWANHYQVRIEK